MAHTWKLVSGSYFFTWCKYMNVCSVMRFYCPPYCRFKLRKLLLRLLPYLTGTLIWVRWYLGSNMGLLWPLLELPGPGLHGKNVNTFFTLWQPMKNWLSIIFPCCTYVSTLMRSAFSETLVLLDLAYVHQKSRPRCPQMKTSLYGGGGEWRRPEHVMSKVY